ncbi:hypothetical protein ONE63_002161 [Megalurothrips usitatus]|uniref:N-acetyltransferase domain-containing protein n=1 Tax=Megalurothrips usitatus TaxID=439358 RepID=A0AAV7XEB9_9NEOP|nr:hypothetical protein ONE63_002161 [Megalurothrips usitatus]
MRLNENTCIVGKAVVLVPYKEYHVTKYHDWMKSEELQHLTASEPLSLEEEYEMQKSWHTDDNKCTFIVLDKAKFDDSGDEINESHHNAEAEIMIAERNARGKKHGWEAMLLMLRYGVEELNIKVYEAKIKFDNTASIKMFSKIGFFEASRSEVFAETTFQATVTEDWIQWLRKETDGYNKTNHTKIR